MSTSNIVTGTEPLKSEESTPFRYPKEPMETTFSLGSLHQNNERRKSAAEDHDLRLKSAIEDACDEYGIPDATRDEITQAGLHRFVIDKDNNVRSIGGYPTLDDFIKAKHDSKESMLMPSATEVLDARNMEKKHLMDLLKTYAKTNDMKGYRATRAEYAKL